MHRLTQAILRAYISPGQAFAQALAEGSLPRSHPGDRKTPSNWPGWARLLPHLLALDPDANSVVLRDLAYDAVWYLIRRGDARRL